MAVRLYACALAAALSMTGAWAQQGAPAQSIEVKGLRDASNWFRVESQHFIVHSDSRRDDVVELLNSLERLDYLLRVYLKPFLVGAATAPKLTMYFHDRTGWLDELGSGPKDAIGLYNSCASGVQAFAFNVEPLAGLDNEQLSRAPLNESMSYIFEAYARHFIYRHTDIRAPLSFIDGFAQYFSSMRFSDNQMAVGRVPLGVGGYLHLLDDGNKYHLTFDDVLDSTPVPKQDQPAVQLEFQARAWNLVHYMMSSDEQRGKLAAYLNMVNEGAAPSRAFAATYGLAGDALRVAMWRYRTGGVKVVRVDVPELPQASMQFQQMTQASGDFVLLDAALKSCPTPAQGERLLRRVQADAARVPGNDFAQLTLSRAQVEWGDPAQALSWLTAFTKRDGKHAEAHYLLGLASLKLAERAPAGERAPLLARARASLGQALALKPGLPDASFALYKAEVVAADEPAKAAVARAIVAWRNGHEVNTFARSAALAYAWMGDPAGSYRAFNLLANNGRDAAAAAWAKDWLGRLGKGVARKDLLAAMRQESGMQPAFREWTVAHVDVLKTVTRNAGLEKAQGYLDSMSMGDPSQPDKLLLDRPSRAAP